MSLATDLYAMGVAARLGPDGKVHLLARRYSKENPRASLCGRKSFVWLSTVDKTPTCDKCRTKANLRPEWNGRHGASLETLADRLRYGGRKGRRAGQRILRQEYPHQAVAQAPKPLRPLADETTEKE